MSCYGWNTHDSVREGGAHEAALKDHKLGLKPKKYTVWKLKCKIRVSAGLVPPEAMREGPFLAPGPALCFWQLLGVLGVTPAPPGSLLTGPVPGFRTSESSGTYLHYTCRLYPNAPGGHDLGGPSSIPTGWVGDGGGTWSLWGRPQGWHSGPGGSRGLAASQGHLPRKTGLDGTYSDGEGDRKDLKRPLVSHRNCSSGIC